MGGPYVWLFWWGALMTGQFQGMVGGFEGTAPGPGVAQRASLYERRSVFTI